MGCAPGGRPALGSIPPAAIAPAAAASDDVGGTHCACWMASGSMAANELAAPGLWLVIVAAGLAAGWAGV